MKRWFFTPLFSPAYLLAIVVIWSLIDTWQCR